MTEDLPLTEWIHQAAAGEPGAVDQLFTQLYPELRRIAHARLFTGGASPLLGTTELVHESFLRFTRARHRPLEGRKHFFTYAAKVMRHVVVDLAREHRAERRGGGAPHLPLHDLLSHEPAGPPQGRIPECAAGRYSSEHPSQAADDTLLRIHDALEELQTLDPALARVVEMQYFAGYSQAEIAELTGACERTVRRQWDKARAFLLASLA